jgi:hypothetical protein
MVILKYNQYGMTDRFIELFENSMINESAPEDNFKEVLSGLSKDLKFNFGLIFTFGAGIKAMYPIVDNLVRNEALKIDLSVESVLLLTLAGLSITYLEESNNKTGEEKIPCTCKSKSDSCAHCDGTGYITSKVTRADARTILEELKLRGIGNGIVKKVVDCFKSIGNIVKMLFKNSPYLINGLIDMFGYTAMLIPTMNAISSLIGEYNLNMETLPGNFLALGVGIGTFLAKRGFNYLVRKLKNKLGFRTSHLDVPTAAKPYEISDGDFNKEKLGKNDLIKEQ